MVQARVSRETSATKAPGSPREGVPGPSPVTVRQQPLTLMLSPTAIGRPASPRASRAWDSRVKRASSPVGSIRETVPSAITIPVNIVPPVHELGAGSAFPGLGGPGPQGSSARQEGARTGVEV